jgi:hypothetical protein
MRQKGCANTEPRNLDRHALRQAGLSGHHGGEAKGLFHPIASIGMATKVCP